MFEHARALPVVLLLMSTAAASAQVLNQPTPMPPVTAESEPWYVSRAPLLFDGTLYFPAGAQVHFNQNEMVRAGFYGAIPVYTRTTLEPRSVIFVPLSGGLMQPYERRRSGELAGTEGSAAPSFPVDNAAEQAGSRPQSLQAPGPPSGAASLMGESRPSPADRAAGPAAATSSTGTTGTARRNPVERFTSASRPQGINAVFIEFAEQRWFSSGQPVPFDPLTFTQIGTRGGLAVYANAASPGTIYVPVSRAAAALVVPYANARGR
jgi:hypothetical protein